MKIKVFTLDQRIFTLDVDPDETVVKVKALLKAEQEELLYQGNEMRNDDKLSEIGVRDGDSIVLVSNCTPIFGTASLSSNELSLTPVGSASEYAAFLQEDRHELIQCKTDLKENEVGVGVSQVSTSSLAENDITSLLLDEERFSEQEAVEGNNDVSEKVQIQTNDTSTHVEEFDRSCRILNSSDKELSSTSIQKVASGDLSDSKLLTSSENVNADMLLPKYSIEMEGTNSVLLDSDLSLPMASPLSSNAVPTATKGYGLKKWRRIRREFAKDASSSLDSTKMLKRGSANILDTKQPNEVSVSSTNAFVKSPGHADRYSHPIESSNHILAVDPTFSAGADDSDDRSSKSSTAASAPKHRHAMPSAAGQHQREKHRVKNVSARQLNSSGLRFQTGNGHTMADTSKKVRSDINTEKESSLSSMESDSRSYGSVLVRRTGSVNGDQLQSESSVKFDREDLYNQQAREAVHRGNGDVSPDCSAEFSCSNNKGKNNDRQLSRECEPLVNSILMLQSAQEALEREVQMFKELGKGIHSLCDDSGKTPGGSTYTMFRTPEACTDYSSDTQGSEFNHVYLGKDVQTLKRQLDEAQLRLREKELRVVELEMVINSVEPPQIDVKSTMELQQKRYQEMEAELEVLFKQNVEAEVQYVVMTKSTEVLSVFFKDQRKLLKELHPESTKEAESLRTVQGQTKLNALNTDTVEEEIPKMQKRIVKFSSCLLIQLILLALVLGLLMLQLSPKSAPVVPT